MTEVNSADDGHGSGAGHGRGASVDASAGDEPQVGGGPPESGSPPGKSGPRAGGGRRAGDGQRVSGSRRVSGGPRTGHGVRVGGWTRFVTARPRLSLFVALLLTALAVVAGSGVADRLGSGGWQDPTAESTYATKALEREFPASQPNLLFLVDSGRATVDAPSVAAEAKRLTARLAGERGVTGVGSYWASGAPALKAKDGHEALIAARITGDEKTASETLDRLAPSYRGTHGPVEIRVGGPVAVQHEMQTTIREDLTRAEMIALPVTLVLLVMVFGSAIAALLPLGVGIVAILGTNAVLRGLTEFTDVSVFAMNLTTALGLGLAIDYALFIVRRFREELARGAAPSPSSPAPSSREDVIGAIATTLRTAGRTVLFSSLTV
ncbi:MMPL family transporter, partial [Streptomyces mirabilis]